MNTATRSYNLAKWNNEIAVVSLIVIGMLKSAARFMHSYGVSVHSDQFANNQPWRLAITAVPRRRSHDMHHQERSSASPVNNQKTKAVTLMCVVAHPDDECFGFGGALALAAERRIETYVVCLTDGQAATYRGDAVSNAALGIIRRREFRDSCEVLGVKQYEVMDYQDGKLEFVDVAAGSAQLVKRMRRFQPDVVITFGSDGAVNTHADHTMASMLTTAAFHWSGRAERYPDLGAPYKPKRLFHLTTNYFLPDRQPPMPMPWTVTLDIRSVRDRKLRAAQQHVSQAPILEKVKPLFEKFGANECYALVAAAELQPSRQTADLFEGLGQEDQCIRTPSGIERAHCEHAKKGR